MITKFKPGMLVRCIDPMNGLNGVNIKLDEIYTIDKISNTTTDPLLYFKEKDPAGRPIGGWYAFRFVLHNGIL